MIDESVASLATAQERHHVDEADLRTARETLARFGYAKVSFLVPQSIKVEVGREVVELSSSAGVRRDLAFRETDGSPRRMRNVRHKEITEHGTVIPEVYELTSLRALLSQVAGEDVLLCPYEPERYVITTLEKAGDTHGWHWDDYAFALVWVIECPPVDAGGYVQCVPGTSWNKENPQINRTLIANPIYSIGLNPGDLYMMRTDTTLHRVHPIDSGRRTIINMGYASQADLDKVMTHETMDALWS
ncbi:hypothetical protein [Nonomuraea sp. NPDC052265]|uniref:HalD/BesD family halogenase n=1 Tax=Nonomuraea sp. NPDC052265 TaxID=3364374 RepID=UPI0037C7E574